MFKWKKNSSREHYISIRKESFIATPSRDSFAVTSPSAVSDVSGGNAAGLFVQDYRDSRQPRDSREFTHSKDVAAHPASVYTPTSSGQSYTSQHNSPEVVSKIEQQPSCHNAQPPKTPSFSRASSFSTPTNFAYLELESHNTAFEQHNRMLCARISELKSKHYQLMSEVKHEEEEKERFQEHVVMLRKRLSQVTQFLEQQRELCGTVDKLIEETEDGYMKIVETSKTILQMLDNDYSQIYKRRSAADLVYAA